MLAILFRFFVEVQKSSLTSLHLLPESVFYVSLCSCLGVMLELLLLFVLVVVHVVVLCGFVIVYVLCC